MSASGTGAARYRLSFARRRVRWEIGIVLALSVVPSALFAILRLVELSLGSTPLGESSVALNEPTATEVWLDLTRRFVRAVSILAPVALVIWLCWDRHRTGFQRLGMDLGRHSGASAASVVGRDAVRGAMLAAAIGVPGLALYVISRSLGWTVQVAAAPDEIHWSAVVALILAAVQAALIEEVVVVGYLTQRLRTIGGSVPLLIATSAVLRGSYHLYQGVPMALGNVVMGVVFACAFWYWRDATGQRRVLPLIIAHGVLDAIAFLGYPLARQLWPQLF